MELERRGGEVERQKRGHPGGNHRWRVTRLGADIGITCHRCRRHVMLPRSYLERRLTEVIPREQVAGDE